MMYKSLIGALALCALTACMDNAEPIAESNDTQTSQDMFSPYRCKDKTSLGYRIKISTKMRQKTLETTPDFKMAGDNWEGSELYEADVKYYRLEVDPDNPASQTTQSDIEYDNVGFEYDNKNLIFKIPSENNLPACQIRFKKNGKSGEHKCEFDKNDVPHRATTFEFSCMRAGKSGLIREEGL